MAWPFADPPNVAVFTSVEIVERGMPIVYVVHEEEDGAWQFHSANGPPSTEDDVRVVGLKSILAMDPSISELADLQFGWRARRNDPDAGWEREPCPN
jgi:hypothetical protein